MANQKKTERKRNILLDFSPWILAVACTLLLALLTLFALSNYQREKQLIVEALNQKGLTLIRFVNSSVRESMRENLRSSRQWVHWEDHMQAAMNQAVEQPGVEYILLIDSSGVVLSGAGENRPENRLDPASLDFVFSLKSYEKKFSISRINNNMQGEKRKFQLVSWYLQPNMEGRVAPGLLEGKTRLGPSMGRFRHHPQFTMVQQELTRLFDLRPLYIVQLDFEQFNSPLKRQFLQIIILLIVILLVGVGGALSFMTLKGLKGSQHRLGEMRAFTHILVSSLPIGLIATDSNGIIKICNVSARKILGIEENYVLGRSTAVCLPAKVTRMFSGDGMGLQVERQAEIHLDATGGKDQILNLASMIVLDDRGAFAGEVLLIRDLTERRLLERELRRNERLAALGKVAAGVAHELRNPLSSIKGLALLLKSKFSRVSNGSETADILVKEVERLNRSIGELLDYAKLGQFNKEIASIEEIVRKTVSLVQVDAESYSISIRLVIGDEIPMVQVDKDKLNQVFLNLFLNSIQAMSQGGELLVEIKRGDQAVQILVRDNGTGIDPEILGRVFDPYFTTKNDGTGLGLAMSSKIVEEHGGQIEIKSVLGEYTEVFVSLPV